jgi:hypothetical protein
VSADQYASEAAFWRTARRPERLLENRQQFDRPAMLPNSKETARQIRVELRNEERNAISAATLVANRIPL